MNGCGGLQLPLPNFPDTLMRGHATRVTCTWIMPIFDVPVRITMSSSYARLRGKHRSQTVPPIANDFTTNVDATLGQQVLDLAQRKRISDVHHHRQAEHFG